MIEETPGRGAQTQLTIEETSSYSATSHQLPFHDCDHHRVLDGAIPQSSHQHCRTLTRALRCAIVSIIRWNI